MTRQVVLGTPISPARLIDTIKHRSFHISFWNSRRRNDKLAPNGRPFLANNAFCLWQINLRAEMSHESKLKISFPHQNLKEPPWQKEKGSADTNRPNPKQRYG
jgi:hypothetical protein